MRRRVFVIAAACLAFTRPARANDPAAAQQLFDQAQTLMRQERWAEACPKLEESQRLDPGDGTVLHLAACREHEGKTATAWALYQDALVAATRSKNKSRARVAQERIDFLGPRLHRLRLKVASGDRKLAGFKIVRDETTTVGSALWNEPFPIDPGAHTLAATADGHRKWTSTVDIPSSAGETTVEVPLLDADPSAAAPPPSRDEARRVSLEEATRGDTQRTMGLAMGGIGVAGLVAGTVFGILAIQKEDEVNASCQEPDFDRCTPQGVNDAQTSQLYGNISTVAFVAGGALAVGGAVLYFTAPRHGARVGVAIAPSSLSFTGRF